MGRQGSGLPTSPHSAGPGHYAGGRSVTLQIGTRNVEFVTSLQRRHVGPPPSVRDRIVGFRRVPARQLRANPRNWRQHPPAQRAALRALLDDVGYADALIARQTPDGLELLDGHLRSEMTPDMAVPVLIVDVDDDEAA